MQRFVRVPDWNDASALLAVPADAGVFRIDFRDGSPYIGKTADLRRRLRRLLAPREGMTRRLHLRDVACGVQYRRTGSPFESNLALYRSARACGLGDGRDPLKLRAPSFVKLLAGNRFPRTCVTQRLARSSAVFYGPFATRKAAEHFQGAFLDLFQVRRCTENLVPSPEHPGCMWGEMGMCLRPCQAACDDIEYANEVARMEEFLVTDGESFLREAERCRDAASASLEFESAERHHRLLEKAKQVLRMRGGLERDLENLSGMMLQRAAERGALLLTPLYRGSFQDDACVPFDGEPTAAAVSAAIRRDLARRSWSETTPKEKQEHLALLQRWHGSSFRRGEFLPFRSVAQPPYRRLANAGLRVLSG